MKIALLIPIYEPSDKVLPFLSSFSPEDFDYFLAVNDGSGEQYQAIFDALETQTPFKVISYPENHGKGHALKTGMKALIEEHPDLDYIVTADSDGQHSLVDINRVKEEAKNAVDTLFLGSRGFEKDNVPFKSRFGNRFSAAYFRMASGKKIRDTQTGLRAIPSCLFDLALKTPGSRFEFEMNFLLAAVREAPLTEVPIETIYEDQGEKHVTHFRPFQDSIRIYKTPLLYLLVSLASFGIDIGLFHLFSTFVFTEALEQRVFISALIARILSGCFNFLMFHFVVFGRKEHIGKSAIRYIFLWTINYFLSSGLTYVFTFVPLALSFIKVLVDIFLAIVNYLVNLTWVFAKKRRRIKAEKKMKEGVNDEN